MLDMNATPLTILAISDGEYVPRLKALSASISQNMPSAHLHALLVNVDEQDDDVAHLKHIHPHTDFSFVYETLDHDNVKLGLDGVTKYTEKAGFCVNVRAQAIYDLLLKGHDTVLFLDADSIVRKDLGALVQELRHHDIMIHKREGTEVFRRVAAGTIAVRRTPASLRFFRTLYRAH